MSLKTPPVLLLAFNRPETTTRVFEAIRRARPARFFFACDGPRSGRPDEAVRVEAVRRMAERVDWPCELNTRFLSENQGCGRGVSSAIDWFLREAGEGVILEDDCLPTDEFFPYAAAMLERYRYDSRVGLISGSNMAPEVEMPFDHGFSQIASTWGWATWRRTWDGYSLTPAMVSEDEDWASFFAGRAFRTVRRSFERIHKGDAHTWDYQLLVQLLRSRQLTVVPRLNMILNIGFQGGGTHFSVAGRPWWAPSKAYHFKGDWGQGVPVATDLAYDRNYVAASHGGGGRLLRAWVKVLRRMHRLRGRMLAVDGLSD
jgi:hypothetical protein